jgi:hypothetical protein
MIIRKKIIRKTRIRLVEINEEGEGRENFAVSTAKTIMSYFRK